MLPIKAVSTQENILVMCWTLIVMNQRSTKHSTNHTSGIIVRFVGRHKNENFSERRRVERNLSPHKTGLHGDIIVYTLMKVFFRVEETLPQTSGTQKRKAF